MKKFIYELFEVHMRGEEGQTDVSFGQFSSLNEVREFVVQYISTLDYLLPEDFDVYRRVINEGTDNPVLIKGWQRLIK